VYDFVEAAEDVYFVMEYLKGEDLHDAIHRGAGGAMPPARAVAILEQIAAALHATHARNIVHRDVSPSNIICSYAGEVKLCDFGIAKATLSRVQTKTGVIKGKVKYMSPEQALGRKLDHRSDVFSLGSCLYEMLTRIPPFTATNEMDLLIKVRDAKYRPIGELQPGVQRLRRVKTPVVARIVGDQDEIAVAGIARDIPVLPAGFANMRNVMGFMAGLSGYGNQVDGETLVDQEPHDTGIAASRRRDRCTG